MGQPERVDDVRRAVAAYLPGSPARSVSARGAGLDNEAYEVDGDLIVRFSTAPDPADRARLVEHDGRLLAAVAAVSPLPTPEPVFVAPELGCLAYRRVPGTPLLDIGASVRAARGRAVATTLGGFLAALHAVPVERFAALVPVDDEPPAAWLAEAAGLYERCAHLVPAAHRPPVEAFLAAEPPDPAPAAVFSHNDLGIEHVLVDPAQWTVTGVIDWSDAALVDPAYDFGLIHRDLGPGALGAALGAYPGGGALRERAVFHARCGALEDLAYGAGPGRGAYRDKSLDALAWLFPA